MRTDRNFRLRQRNKARDSKQRRRLMKGSPRCGRCRKASRTLEMHHMGKKNVLLCKACHRALHDRAGDYNSKRRSRRKYR